MLFSGSMTSLKKQSKERDIIFLLLNGKLEEGFERDIICTAWKKWPDLSEKQLYWYYKIRDKYLKDKPSGK